jgi:hypothetical protein
MRNVILFFTSIFFSLVIIEFSLRAFGMYSNLANTKLVASDAIYERPKNSYQKQKHPDVNYVVTNYYDFDGVKNNTSLTTSKKKNIIAFFGDSFTENVAVDPIFEFSNMLKKKIKNYEIVNYGIGGYEIDSIFLRYNKFKDHDIKYIFYLYFPGDENLSKIIKFDENNNLIINKIKINYFYQLIGRLNITYLVIDSFYIFRSLLYSNHSVINVDNYNQILANKIAKSKQQKPQAELDEFFNILKKFQEVAERNQVNFTVLVFPTKGSIEFFNTFIKNKDYKINYVILNEELNNNPKLRFKNDPHWNEYGNLEYAKNLYEIFIKKNLNVNELSNFSIEKNSIDSFYQSNSK